MEYTVTHLKPFGVLIEAQSQGHSIDNLNMDELRNYFNQDKLVVLRGFKTFESADEFANYCDRWGEVSLWPFGKVLELEKQNNPQDHIFDTNYVPMHWDGMYRPEIPEYQIFHCVDSPDKEQGGRTTFSNTSIALKNVPANLIELWKNTKVRYTRKMEFYDSTTVSPIVTKHPYKETMVMRYNEPPSENVTDFINPPVIEFVGVATNDLGAFQSKVKEALYSPEAYYAHTWHQHDVVISDNFSLLHGREAYTKEASRHLQRVHVNSSPAYKNPGLEEYR